MHYFNITKHPLNSLSNVITLCEILSEHDPERPHKAAPRRGLKSDAYSYIYGVGQKGKASELAMAHVAVKEVENPRNPPLVRWKNNKLLGFGLDLTGI